MDKRKLENKMKKRVKTIWLKNVRSVALHGRGAGSEFRVKCDNNGTPCGNGQDIDKHLRRRMFDNDFVLVKKTGKGAK